MRRILLFILILLFVSLGLHAQTSQDLAREAYVNAETAYTNQKFDECVSNCKSIIELMGNTDSRIQYLLSKALFQLQDYAQAMVQIQKFFDLNPPMDDVFREIISLKNQIDKYLTEQKKLEDDRKEQERLRLLEQEAWNAAVDSGTKEDFVNYNKTFPTGIHGEESMSKLDDFSWKEATYRNTLDSYKKYLIDYPDGLYTSIAKGKVKVLQDDLNFKKYIQLGDESVNSRKWETAIDNYERALIVKPNDLIGKEKLQFAQKEKEKEDLIAGYNDELIAHENARKNYKRGVVRAFIWTGIYIGGAVALNNFVTDGNAELYAGLSGLTGIITFSLAIARAVGAADEKAEANELRKKIQELSFAPIVNPVKGFYGCGITMRIK
jgi:outer membrane protein assembly factor BamD (BamD/ComL family)